MKKCIPLILALLISSSGCQTGRIWSAEKLKKWYLGIKANDSRFLSPLFYQGTDTQYHYFICRSIDVWIPIQVKKDEIQMEEIFPYTPISKQQDFPGCYAVDPENGFSKITENQSANKELEATGKLR